MFGVAKSKLVVSLGRIKKALCAYRGKTCDCKYIKESDNDSSICRGSESASGCPEVMEVIAIVNAMTPVEFRRIAKRAGLIVEAEEV